VLKQRENGYRTGSQHQNAKDGETCGRGEFGVIVIMTMVVLFVANTARAKSDKLLLRLAEPEIPLDENTVSGELASSGMTWIHIAISRARPVRWFSVRS